MAVILAFCSESQQKRRDASSSPTTISSPQETSFSPYLGVNAFRMAHINDIHYTPLPQIQKSDNIPKILSSLSQLFVKPLPFPSPKNANSEADIICEIPYPFFDAPSLSLSLDFFPTREIHFLFLCLLSPPSLTLIDESSSVSCVANFPAGIQSISVECPVSQKTC